MSLPYVSPYELRVERVASVIRKHTPLRGNATAGAHRRRNVAADLLARAILLSLDTVPEKLR